MTYDVVGTELHALPEPVLEPSREVNDRLLRMYVLHLMGVEMRRAFLRPDAEGARA